MFYFTIVEYSSTKCFGSLDMLVSWRTQSLEAGPRVWYLIRMNKVSIKDNLICSTLNFKSTSTSDKVL